MLLGLRYLVIPTCPSLKLHTWNFYQCLNWRWYIFKCFNVYRLEDSVTLSPTLEYWKAEHGKMSNYYSHFVDFQTYKYLKLSAWIVQPKSLSRSSFVNIGLFVNVICCMFTRVFDREYRSATLLLVSHTILRSDPKILACWLPLKVFDYWPSGIAFYKPKRHL